MIRQNKEGVDLSIGLGRTLRAMRKTAKVSQQEFGSLLRVHQSAICRIEQGSQSLTPEQLFIISQYFGAPIDSILAGEVDYYRIAEKFGTAGVLPRRYSEFPFSKVREMLPLLEFTRTEKGFEFLDNTLAALDLDPMFLRSPDMTIGVNCNLDFARTVIEKGILTKDNFTHLIDHTRSPQVQGFLHRVYETQASSLPLIQTWILNAHHYESNFSYRIEDLRGDSLELSIAPSPHMRKIQYKDETLGDFLCRYKKEYISNLPVYINHRPVQLTEKHCHFHGSEKCVYEVRVA